MAGTRKWSQWWYRVNPWPVGRGSSGTAQLGQSPIDRADSRPTQASQGIVQPEGFDVAQEGLFRIGNGLVFGLSFSVGRDVRHPSGKTTLLRVPDEFDN